MRILAAFIDAWADHNWGIWETALLVEGDRESGWNDDAAARQLKEWGVVDQHGVYALAGLTKRQTEVAFMYFDRQLEPAEIAGFLACDAITVRRHLQGVRERLGRLSTVA